MTYYQVKSIIVVIGLLISFGVVGWRLYQYLWVNLRRGRASLPIKQWGERVKSVVVFVAAQLRLFRFLVPGTAHFFIFWGFLFLSLTILQAIIEGIIAFADPHYSLPFIGDFGPLALAQDLFAVFVTVAVLYALYVRIFVNPERYKGSHKSQGVMVLSFILIIMLSLLVMNGIRGNLDIETLQSWRPISKAFGSLFANMSEGTQTIVEEISYWIHLGIVLLFLTELPTGKHFHVITSVPAVFLRNLEAPGILSPAPEFNGDVGVGVAEQFTWRQMLDFYTCTECGRCQEVCPAYQSGLPLSPKMLIMNLRDNLKERGDVLKTKAPTGEAQGILKKTLLGDVITEDELWACTTCYACDQECPLFVGHVPPIVDMRRRLVIDGRIDDELQDALMNLGRYGNSFGQSARARARWTESIQPKIKDARREQVDYLWFVGDYASYSPTLTEITQKTAQVLQKAGVDFGILYDAEQNSGNDVRRVGEDGLFEMLVEKNLNNLSRSKFNTIVTTDPHTYNTLKNEYLAFNGEFEVVHYTELLDELIRSGQLKFSKKLDYQVTYQDPCYLGRYNGIYDPPRRVIEATGSRLVEMPRNRDRALCCAAGGGRIWMAEGEIKERPSEMRVQEAVDLDRVNAFIVTCPKDVTMFQDAIKTTGNEDKLVVKDLIELVYEAL
jgi:Fe-S oxidoreductase